MKKEFIFRKNLLIKMALLSLLIIGIEDSLSAYNLTVDGEYHPGYSMPNLPIYGTLIGSTKIKCEFQIPKEKISSMAEKEITQMALSIKTPSATTWGTATFQVYIEEITKSAYNTSLIKGGDAVLVYEGSLDPTASSLVIPFSKNTFIYTGENDLLIAIYCEETGSNGQVEFNLWRDSYTYYTIYTSSNKGDLTIAAWLPISIFTYQDVVVETPRLAVSPSSVDFGKVSDDNTQTITVSNTGVRSMDVTISNDNITDFTISTTSLTSIGAGESKTFDVTFNYNGESLGEKSANITITPDYDAEDAKVIAVSAKSVDPKLWEDFSEGIPSTWYNEDNGWITTKTGFLGEAYVNNSSMMLRTPRLTAVADEDISFDVNIGSGNLCKITAKYSTDRITWTEIGTYTTSGNQSFTAPSAGDYWIQFTGFQSSIDNMTGWTVSDVTHDVELGSASIPTSGTHHGTYTASVNVMELGGSEETLTAKLYFGDEVVATKEVSINGNRDETISLSYTPLETWSGKVYIKVTGENIDTLTTSQKDVTINNPILLDETTSSSKPTSSNEVIQINYTPKAGWGTICVPFVLTTAHMNTIFGTGWTAYSYTSFSDSDGQLTFSKRTTFSACTPYLIYAPNAKASDGGFYLQGVSLSLYNWNKDCATTVNGVTFQGTYAPMAAGSLEGCYGVTESGQIAKGSDKAWMNGYRAYLTGIPDGSSVKMFVIDGDDATDVGLMQMVKGEDKAVYNISGQRVQKARKGLYIIGGKKVIIK